MLIAAIPAGQRERDRSVIDRSASFSSGYQEARLKFLAVAIGTGTALDSIEHPERGSV